MIRGMREIRDTLIEGFVFDTNIFKARGADETDLIVDRDNPHSKDYNTYSKYNNFFCLARLQFF